jgi:excisionase family DNA binding protein
MIFNRDEYFTVPEAARNLRVNEETVRRNVRSGRLKAEKIGNQWFIRKSDLSSFAIVQNSQTKGEILRIAGGTQKNETESQKFATN